ncbi:MAG: hypothetical protein KAZ94_05190 [Burkholderiales bacterium]|nr:hypothetical protein [Burkholderiales bacterium]MBP9769738.1 hypothetical protein [Burkholderiales bacterium]
MKLGKTKNINTWLRHMVLFYRERIFRQLIPIMSLITIYSIIIVHLDRTWILFDRINNLNLGQFHLIFSFILGIIISFRVNTTYARWWEGRVLWGSIVNNCRNLGFKFDTFVGLEEHQEFYAYLRAFPVALKFQLRKDRTGMEKEFQKLGVDSGDIANPVLFLVNRMYKIINELRDSDQLRFEQYMALDTHLVNLIDMVGGCERILNTPPPAAFAFFVKQGLLFYALIFPFGWAEQFGYLIIPLLLVLVYILLGLEMLAEELEDPFGTDDNDLPLDAIAKNIVKNITFIAEQPRK